MIPAWYQLVPISGHVEESETARNLQLYATSIKTSVSTRLIKKTMTSIANPCTNIINLMSGNVHLYFHTVIGFILVYLCVSILVFC